MSSVINPSREGISRYSILRVFNRIRVNNIVPFTTGGSVVISGYFPENINDNTIFVITAEELINAVNTLNTGGTGGMIVVSRGTFDIGSTSLTLNGNIRITGGGTIVNSENPIFILNGDGNLIENVKITKSTSGLLDDLITINGNNNVIQDCFLTFNNTNQLNSFITITGNDNLVRRCLMFSDDFDTPTFATTGVIVDGNRNCVLGCQIVASTSIQCNAAGQNDNQFSDNTFLSTIHLDLSGVGFRVHNNMMISGFITMDDVSNSSFVGNHLECDLAGITMNDTTNCVFASNYLVKNFGLSGTGFNITGGFTGNVLNDNMVRDFTTPMNINPTFTNLANIVAGNTFISENETTNVIVGGTPFGDVKYGFNQQTTGTQTATINGGLGISLNGLEDRYVLNVNVVGGDCNFVANLGNLTSAQVGKVVIFDMAIIATDTTSIIRIIPATFEGGTEIQFSGGSGTNATAVLVWTGNSWTMNENFAN